MIQSATPVVISDPRLDRLAESEAYAEIRVNGLGRRAVDVLLEWLPPFFLCRADDGESLPARSWTVEVSTHARTSSPSFRIRDGDGVIQVAANADQALTAGTIVKLARAVLKALAIDHGGMNLHASAVARGGASVLLTGPRHAGKTTVMLAALSSGTFDFLANDQVVLMTLNGATTAWGYPALIKVRAPSAASLDLGEPLYLQPDDGPLPASEPSALYLPAAVARSFGVAVVGTGRPAIGVVYEQSDRNRELVVREDEESIRRWDETSRFPMSEAYPRALMDVVQELVGSSLQMSGPARAEPRRRLSVRCGQDRIGDLVLQLAAMVDGSLQE